MTRSTADSGIEELSQVPAEWAVSGLGRFTRLVSGAGFPLDEQGVEGEDVAFYKVNALGQADPDGVIRKGWDTISLATAHRLRAPLLRPGTIVLAKIGAALQLGRVRRTDRLSTIDNNMLAVIPSSNVDPAFLAYALQTFDFDALVNPGAVPSLDMRAFRQRPTFFPPLEEQRAIAEYLDRETAQIDALIAKNEELITLLAERRAAVVANAVLRGLDAAASLRDSGVAWLGEVPTHWRVSRLSRWFQITLGKMLDEAKFASTVGDVLPYVRASNIKAERLDLLNVKAMPFTASEQAKFSLRAGDLVVVEGGSIGVNAPILDDMEGWGFQKTVNRVRSRNGDLTRFLGYQLDVIRDAGVLNMIANVSTIQHLTAEKLERLVVAMPPTEEQARIVSHIGRSTSVIDRAIGTAERGVELARERRTALISAAVTGKIDVGVAA